MTCHLFIWFLVSSFWKDKSQRVNYWSSSHVIFLENRANKWNTCKHQPVSVTTSLLSYCFDHFWCHRNIQAFGQTEPFSCSSKWIPSWKAKLLRDVFSGSLCWVLDCGCLRWSFAAFHNLTWSCSNPYILRKNPGWHIYWPTHNW